MQSKSIRGSEQGLAPKEGDHLLLESRKRPSEGHNGSFHQKKVITYILSAEQDHQRVRTGFCTKERHLHAECKTRPLNQNKLLHQRKVITYMLSKTIRGSEQGLTFKEGDHLHTECRTRLLEGQNRVLY